MSGNSFGKLFVVTTFGESHGRALGVPESTIKMRLHRARVMVRNHLAEQVGTNGAR